MTELFVQPLFDWRSAIASPYGPKSPTTRHVLLTLALHMSHKGGSCYPAQDSLADQTGLSRRAIVTHLLKAEKAGWLAKRERTGKSTKGWRRLEYYALIPSGVEQKVKKWDDKARTAKLNPDGGERPSPPKGGAPRSPAKHLSTDGGAPRSLPSDLSTDGGERPSPPSDLSTGLVVNDVHTSSSSTDYPKVVAAAVNPRARGAPPVDNSQTKVKGAAAADLIWPQHLPKGQQAAIEHYLRANPSANTQVLLDELSGVMRDEALRDPVAFFLHIAKQQAVGKFLPSHAHRVQVEREGEAVERALRAHPNP